MEIDGLIFAVIFYSVNIDSINIILLQTVTDKNLLYHHKYL